MRLEALAPIFLVTAIASAMWVTRVQAAPTSKLTYVRGGGAEACPDESELRHAVAKRVGYDPFFPWAERTVVALIDAETGNNGFTGQVRIIDAQGKLLGERKLVRMSDCSELVQSVALAISVAIDDVDGATASPPPMKRGEEAPSPVVERTSESVIDDDRDREPHRPPTNTTQSIRWRLRTTLGAEGTVGAAPSPSLGAVVGVAARANWFWVGIEGRADAPSGEAVEPGPSGTIATSLLMGSIVPCGAVENISPSSYLYFCGVASVGSLRAESEDVSGPKSSSARWLAVGGRAGIAVKLAGDWLEMYGQLDAGATLTRHRVDLNGREVYRVPTGSMSIGAGLVASFL